MKFLAVLFLLILLPAVGISQTVWYVDASNTGGPWNGSQLLPFQKIQDGIDAASDHDIVLVAPGTYFENIIYDKKAVWVRSEQGPVDTCINGSQAADPDKASVVTFRHGEGHDSIIDGFTLCNGTGTEISSDRNSGGAVFCWEGSSPTIQNNIITNNTVEYDGGGIYCYNGCSPIIRNNLISNNYCGGDHGGSGGGILCSENCNPIIINNFIHDNDVEYEGGGVSFWHCFDAKVVNCTICYNQAKERGGGIDCTASNVTVLNTIVWNNKAPKGSEISVSHWVGPDAKLDVDYSDVMGGNNPPFVEKDCQNCQIIWGENNIQDDPPIRGSG